MKVNLEIKRMLSLLLLAAFACALLILRGNLFGGRVYSFMIWNLFLALVPYGISYAMLLICNLKESKWRTYSFAPLGVMWLLFFPNAPYLFTSYMLFSRVFSFPEGNFMIFSIQPWYDFVLLSSFIWCGILAGLASLGIVHGMIEKRFGKITGWLVVVITSFLSSWAIYLGRFIRLNSWDVFTNPGILLPYLRLCGERTLFIFLLGVFLVLVYIVTYFFEGKKKIYL